jgi:hypothetical protein
LETGRRLLSIKVNELEKYVTKGVVVKVGIGICAVLFVSGIAAHRAVAGPKATMSESRFDFGLVPQNAKISHVFWIHSSGDQELKIINVSPGCGCTQAPLEKNILPAGDSTRLEIIFNTGAYTGQVVKHPSFTTNADSTNVPIVFLANVTTLQDSTRPIMIEPNRFDLTPVGEGKKVEFKITNVSDKEVALKLISSPAELYEVKLPGKIPAGQEKNGTITLTKKAFENSTEKSFTIEVNNGEVTRFTVPVVHEAVSAAARLNVSNPKTK